MFLDSTKVKVIESSVSANKLGPVKGSIGYVIPHRENFNYIITEADTFLEHTQGKQTSPFVFGDHNRKNTTVGSYQDNNFLYLIKGMDVFFTRYGNEKKNRVECKPVINIFPFPISNILNEKAPETYLSPELINYATDYVLTMDNQKDIKDTPTVCVMIPYYTNNLIDITENQYEYSAWCNSVLKNDLLRLYIKTTRDNNLLRSDSIYRYLRDYTLAKNYTPKLGLVETFLNNDKRQVVTHLRKVLASMVNNYDIQSKKDLSSQANMIMESGYKTQANLIGAQAWKIGFNSNSGVINIKHKALNKILSRLVSVQQDLLSKSTSV